MGKFFKWLLDANYRRVRKYKKENRNQDILYDFKLTGQSFVMDVGAYTGGYGEGIAKRYGAKVYAFEPVEEFAKAAEGKLAPYGGFVYMFGLGARDEEIDISLSEDASSVFAVQGSKVRTIKIRDISGFIAEASIGKVDLMAINIEGAEYDMIERLVETGDIGMIANILVQCHSFVPDYKARYKRMAQALSATHRCKWRYPFVWEAWERIS